MTLSYNSASADDGTSAQLHEEINKTITYYCESFYDFIRPQMVLHGRTPLEEFQHLNACMTYHATRRVGYLKCLVNIAQAPKYEFRGVGLILG